MRCPPRHESGMDAITFAPVALIVQPQAYVTHKRPLTNRIRRHFARIKAEDWIAAAHGYCGKRKLGRRQEDARETSNDAQDTSKPTSRAFADESSGTKVRKRRVRRPGRSCRPPFHCRLPHGSANDVPCPPRSPARRCDQPSGRSAPRG